MAVLGSMNGSGACCSHGELPLPEEVDVLRRLDFEQLLDLVWHPRQAELGEMQAPMVLVDPGRRPVPGSRLRAESVILHVYNLSENVVQANALLAFSMNQVAVGGAFHVGIEVYGSEYAYGVCGVAHLLPRAEEDHVYQCSVYLGDTTLSREQLVGVLAEACRRWSGADYDVLGCNCCCFCAELSKSLGVQPLPLWVDRLSRLLLSGREAGREALLVSVQSFLKGSALLQSGLEALIHAATKALAAYPATETRRLPARRSGAMHGGA